MNNYLTYSQEQALTELQREGENYFTRLVPKLTPREAGQDGTEQGEPLMIHYRQLLPADKSVLELKDAYYTWQLTSVQIEQIEAFIQGFDPERDAIPKPPLSLEDRLRLALEERERRLRATDYLMLPDYPISDEMRQKVVAYRQALRDLPEQDEWPDIVDWPHQPVLNPPDPVPENLE